MLVKNWGRDAAVHYSGVTRAGDPLSLLADNTGLRQLPFNWQISIDRGLLTMRRGSKFTFVIELLSFVSHLRISPAACVSAGTIIKAIFLLR
jgi:hypothetical protein